MRWDARLRVIGWRVSGVLRPYPRLNAAMWNVQYKLGIWDYLSNGPDGDILRLVEQHSPHATILDLGCGASANLPLIPGTFERYHGVDISESAIREARALQRPGTSFEVADISTYQPGERYDAILL
jgi:trans-aconitate methyltransferase